MKLSWSRALPAVVVALALIAGAIHLVVTTLVRRVVNVSVEFGSEVDEEHSRRGIMASLASQPEYGTSDRPEPVESHKPFREVDVLDEDAKDWSSFFDGYANTGVLVFDANGDGRLDLYLLHNNATWVRPTDPDGVLESEPRISGNGLYLNQGNDASGAPVYAQVKELVSADDVYSREELLVEDYLEPRVRAGDAARKGRASSTAMAADLDNDGDLDLIVGNTLPGMLWSHPKTQRVLGQFVRPVGRRAVNTKMPLAAQGLYFLKDYVPSDQTDDTRHSSRGEEPFGANSVYLNLGDRDGDGVPEWEDASRRLGVEGSRNTMALVVFDFDLDGDLDLFEANIMDMDYWPGGATSQAGAANQLYVNQLAETGTLTFVQRAAELDVDGIYDADSPQPEYLRLYKIPLLPAPYSIAFGRFERYTPDYLEINGERSERGQISWAAVAQDVNQDGYPDIWVGNDLGYLRLYVNLRGEGFERSTDFPRADQTGYWMSFSPGDFNGDLKEDLFAGNMGGASMNLAMPIPDMYMLFDPVMSSATLSQQFFGNSHNSMHALIDGASGFTQEMPNEVYHSRALPPDASLKNNVRDVIPSIFSRISATDRVSFDPGSLDPYEFAWGSTTLDVQNDGRLDLYWVGALHGRGGGTFPIMGTGPGRLLVNMTERPERLRFADLTAEHHLFNIHELQYDRLVSDGFVSRRSPLQNWGKRSMVYSSDVSVWGFQGPGIVERITNHDLIQASENGRAAVAADLNNDGFADIVVRNIGGYDSRSSDAVNLKARVSGKIKVIPAHDANFPTPTNFEPGSTRVFMNTYQDGHWIKITLVDDAPGSFNRDAIGAEVIVNGRLLRVNRGGSGGFVSNYVGPLLFGLAQDSATSVEVRWPDEDRTVTRLDLPGYHNGSLLISRINGVVGWQPAERGN